MDLSKDRRIFWVSGKPGSGKSTLMKLAFQARKTRELLQTGCSTRPILAAFFFYDRGSPFQKSMEGFLYELLYQILREAKELMPVVCSTFETEVYPRTAQKLSEFGMQASSAEESISQYYSFEDESGPPRQINWTIRQLRRCLNDILTQRHTPLKICFCGWFR